MTEYLNLARSLSLTQLMNAACFKLLPRREILAYKPVTLNAILTMKCNLSCPTCAIAQMHFLDSSYKMPSDMTLRDFSSLIERFGKYLLTVILSGGEPLLHKEVFRMARHASSKRLLTQLITNGLLMGKHIPKILEHMRSINVSLNAVDAKEYHLMHNAHPKLFESVIENTTKLVEMREKLRKRAKIAISYVCTKNNFRRIPEFITLAESLRVDEANLRSLISLGLPGFEESLCLYRDDDEVADVLKSITPPKRKMKVYLPKLYERTTLERDCRMPFEYLTVDGDRNAYPCCIIPSPFGCENVFSSEDIWNGKIFRILRKSLIDKSAPLPHTCLRCGCRFLKRRTVDMLRKVRK